MPKWHNLVCRYDAGKLSGMGGAPFAATETECLLASVL